MAISDLFTVHGRHLRLHHHLHNSLRNDSEKQWAHRMVYFNQNKARKNLPSCYTLLECFVRFIQSNSPPYDENTIFGYFLKQFTIIICSHAYSAVYVASVAFFFGVCFYLEAFCSEHASMIRKCDDLIVSGRPLADLNIKEQIIQSLRMHMKILQ